MATFSVKNFGEFESPHNDAEVVRRLTQYHREGKLKSDFAYEYGGTLLGKYRKYGQWFPNQSAWAHFFVFQVEQPLLADRKPPKIGGMQTIVEHLQRCRESRDQGGAGLKNPQVRIDLDGTKFTLKLAGPRSRNKGSVSVAESHRFGEGRFFGWIRSDGTFERRGCCGQDVVDLLQRIAVDPATQISEIGKEAGMCCYCWAPLSQVQSKLAGCGKTCADNYGAWYPNAAETREQVAEHPEVLVGATDAERWEDSAPPLTRDVPQAKTEMSEEDELEAHLHTLMTQEDS
jgi:hypothetical protein